MFTRRTVLLVDDAPQTASLLRRALVSRGSNVIEVQGRDQAIALLRDRMIDLIVLDMNGPTGVDTCRTIRGCSDIPIILVAACQSERERVEALDGGADDFVSKPFSLDELLARVRVVFRRAMVSPPAKPNGGLIRLPCGHYQTEETILRMAARIAVARSEAAMDGNTAVGRPRKIATCRKCGASGGTLEMRSHKCDPENLASLAACSGY